MGALEPSWLPGYRVRILDGNALSATDRRLLELRPFWDAPLPGKVLAVLERQSGLVRHLFQTPDGHAQERSLLPEVIALVEAGDRWIADRNFCTHQFLHEIDSREGFFVIRRHGTVRGHPAGEWSAESACPTGRVREQTLAIHREGKGKTFRRIRVALNEPTRDGDGWIEILTNLPAEVDHSVVASLYQRRWRIETLFWEMAETLHGEPATLCQPQGFLFVFGMGLVASNAVRVFKGAIRRVHGASAWETRSLYYLMGEVVRFSGTMEICRETASWQEWHHRSEEVWLAELLRVAGQVRPGQYRKAPKRSPPSGAKRGKYQRDAHRNGGHTSTQKILEGRKVKDD